MLLRILQNPKFYNGAFTRALLQYAPVRVSSGLSVVDVAKVTGQKPAKTFEEEKKRLLTLINVELPKPYDGPERDHVNFPRPVRREHPDIIRYGFIPQEYLDFFYKKTGVTGPYVFGLGLVTFLVSKELYVLEEEFAVGITLVLLIYIAMKKFGPKTRELCHKWSLEDDQKFDNMKGGNMKALEDFLAKEKKMQWEAGVTKTLLDAKRENVQIQLETEYRKRMMNVYGEVKRRLDYFFYLDATRRKLEQKHMVEWIAQNVVKSITPQQEKDALQKCIADLKVLASRSA